MVSRPRWDVAHGIELYKSGWTVPEVAAEMGVGPSTVYNRFRGAGVKLRHSRGDIDTAEIVRLRSVGRSWAEIASAVGSPRSTARYRYSRASGADGS